MRTIIELLLLVKDTKFESKSQHITISFTGRRYCFYWSKIQNLKANHNTHTLRTQTASLLLLVKDTKFESKSQLKDTTTKEEIDCFYWSKIQNLKANHNSLYDKHEIYMIAFTGQRYKI